MSDKGNKLEDKSLRLANTSISFLRLLQDTNSKQNEVTYIEADSLTTGIYTSTSGQPFKPNMYASDVSTQNAVFANITSALATPSVSTTTSIESDIEKTVMDNEAEAEGPFQMTYSADVGWTIFFGIMIGSAIIGNLVIVWIVLGKT